MQLDELTARNRAFALLGITQESGKVDIHMFDQPLYYAAIKFVGPNVAGPQWTFTFPLVIITPNKAMSLISAGSGAWGTIDLQADVLKDTTTGQFCIAEATDFV